MNKIQTHPENADPEGSGNWISFDGRTYNISEGRSALEAMLAGGANVVFSCRKGVCRSCMLEAVSGDPGADATERLPENLQAGGAFLPCVASKPVEVVARLPDRSKYLTRAVIADRRPIGDKIHRIVLETETVMDWRVGQFITVRGPSKTFRSYSIVSRPDDYFVEIHVRHFPDGVVSDWLVASTEIGDVIEFTGPSGHCYYHSEDAERPILLVGTGVGLGMLLGLARDALEKGHTAPVRLFHGSRVDTSGILEAEMTALEAAHPNFTAQRTSADDALRGVTAAAFDGAEDLSSHAIFLCGAADMVEQGRILALRQAAPFENIYADPYDSSTPYRPRDREKIEAIEADPEIWAALDNGERLSRILTDFYGQVFEDPRLMPFFRRVTKQRLIEKQYAFLADLFTGSKMYFGERPFNAHHWMIISDELFEYRERLFFTVLRKHGFPEGLVPRWKALHEMFRREIVKNQMRGQWFEGREIFRERYEEEAAPIDLICDECGREVATGETVRMHQRTGEVYCAGCAGY